jgi:hypothetical protein
MTTNSSPSRPRGAYPSDIERAVEVASSLRLRRPLRRVASPATPLVAALPLVSLIARDSPSGSRASFARDALRQRSWLAKKNPNPRKINDLRSSDRHIAAYNGTQYGTQHPKRHPRGTGFKRRDSLHAERSTGALGAVARSLWTIRPHSALGYRPPAAEFIALGEEFPMNHEAA